MDGVTGLRVNGESVSDVAEAVSRLLWNSALARELGDNGYARAIREFSWECVAEKTRQVATGHVEVGATRPL